MGAKFARINIKWDYTKQTCCETMKNYISDLLNKYNHLTPKNTVCPACPPQIIYSTKEQLLPEADMSPRLNPEDVKHIQGIIGSLLYYAHVVNNKLLATLSMISSQQTTAIVNTAKAVTQLLNYVAICLNDGITYRASNMVLAAHSDASFLTKHGSRSRAGTHIYLTENDPIP